MIALGIIAVVVGAVFAIAEFTGREIGGRKHWYRAGQASWVDVESVRR